MFPQKRQNNIRNGFTLVEILVTVMVLAIAAAMVAPYMSGSGDFQAASAARILASDLQYAQNTAITSQDPVTVTFDPNSESYHLSNASGQLIHPITKSAYVVSFSSREGFDRLDVASASFDGAMTVTFDVLGSPDHPGSVTLQAGPHVYQVDVAAATGNVTVTASGT